MHCLLVCFVYLVVYFLLVVCALSTRVFCISSCVLSIGCLCIVYSCVSYWLVVYFLLVVCALSTRVFRIG